MTPHLPLSILVVALAGIADEAFAQPVARTASPAPREASAVAGRLLGTVEDETGAALHGASILAVGTTLAVGKTDGRGRFSLDLPAGLYIVRAERPGYISTYAELARVQANGWVERNIRLMRAPRSPALPADQSSGDSARPRANPADGAQNHGEIAWRLRHLTRTVLRDVAPSTRTTDTDGPASGALSMPPSSLIEWAVQGSARAASSFFVNTDFTGQVNLLTTSSMAVVTAPAPLDWSQGIADVIIGAPVGVTGDWSVRGALAPGDASSWTLLGEYRNRADQRHAFRLAVAYSMQGFVTGREPPRSVVVPGSRSAGGIRVSDRWHVPPGLELDYGLRFDRVDYLTQPSLISPRIGARVRAFGRTFAVVSTSQRMIVPGAEDFLPPSGAGPWLPPTRTFSSLWSKSGLRPEQVRQHTTGVEHEFGRTRRAVARIEWFAQSAAHQLATLYGLDPASEVGHYYIATAGDVDVVGWRARLGGNLMDHVRGSVEYAKGEAQWSGARMAGALRRNAPALARRGAEQISELRASLDVTVPRTATRVTFGYRANGADRVADTPGGESIGDGRFNLELRQKLPYQPLDGGMLHLLFTLRTLVHDDESGSLYDELLTLRPPAQVTGGLQVRF